MSDQPSEAAEQGTDVAVRQPPRRADLIVIDDAPLFDTAKFEQMVRVAKLMASSSLIPDALRAVKDGSEVVVLAPETVTANCFLIVNQSARWGMDPFAVAQCCAVVHGKLMYEGKLVHAVIEKTLSVRLNYEFGKWNKETERVDLAGQGVGDDLGVIVSGVLPGEDTAREIHGNVGNWKTTVSGSPWRPGAWHRQLRYRGAREWARAFAPGPMLGVMTDDEISALAENSAAARATPVNSGVAARLPGARTGFSEENVNREIEQVSEETTGAKATSAADPKPEPQPEQKTEQEPAASEKSGPSGTDQASQESGGAQAEAEAGATPARRRSTKSKAAADKTADADASAAEGAETGSESASSTLADTVALTIEDLRNYSNALFRAMRESSLPTFRDDFWKLFGEARPGFDRFKVDEQSAAKLKAIYDAHKGRLTTNVELAGFDREILRIITG